ncbi:MAG: DNA polymerase I [Eubacteriales bacterium]
MKKLLVVDGFSLMFRAFYAIPMLSKNGEFTNAVFGFFSMLYPAIKDIEPDYLAVAMDSPGKTFRHEDYAEYKAKRKETPKELLSQFPLLTKTLSKLNIPILAKEGFEADDFIGAASVSAKDTGVFTYIITGDKDLLQLINKDVNVLLTRKGISDIVKMDEGTLFDTYSLTPPQVIDFKALSGDPSDNIPGVLGIGEKTATKLILDYGNIDNIYAHIDEIKGKLKEKLLNGKESAYLSQKLATIDTCCEKVDLKSLKFNGLNEEVWRPVFELLGFKSLLKRMFSEKLIEAKKTLIEDEAVLNRLIDSIDASEDLAFLYNSDEISFAVSKEEDFVFPIKGILKSLDLNTILKKVFGASKGKYKVTHDFKTAQHMIEPHIGSRITIDFDTMIAKYVLDPNSKDYSAKKLCESFNASMCAASLLGIAKKQLEELNSEELNKVYFDIEMPLINVLYDMETIGFSVNKDLLLSMADDYEKRISSLEQGIYEDAGEEFNINSPKQLGEVLFVKMGMPAYKKVKSGFSTDASVLEGLFGMHPIIEKLLEFRQLSKIKSTYIDGLLSQISEGKIHTTFKQEATVTGRISSTEPNLQNIPIKTMEGKEIRKVFIPSQGCVLVSADYSQIELRLLAHVSNDANMKQAFLDNLDIHAATAAHVFNVPLDEVTEAMRRTAKAVNFGIVYGISDFGLSRNLKISQKQASEYIKEYFSDFSGVKEYMDEIVKQAQKDGFVRTLFGRKRKIDELYSPNYNIREFGKRSALNTPIQGGAADIIKIAMIRVYNALLSKSLKSKLILQVHDELIVDTLEEVDEVKAILKSQMEGAAKLSVPLKGYVSVGSDWYSAK